MAVISGTVQFDGDGDMVPEGRVNFALPALELAGSGDMTAVLTKTVSPAVVFDGTGNLQVWSATSRLHTPEITFSGDSDLSLIGGRTIPMLPLEMDGVGDLSYELCFANGMTVAKAVDAIVDIWGVYCGCDCSGGSSPQQAEALMCLNTAIQRLFQTGKLHGFVNRVQRSYTGTRKVGSNWLRAVTLENDVQSIDGNVELWFPGPHWKLYFNVATTTVQYAGIIKLDADVHFSDGTTETYIMGAELVTDFIEKLTGLKSLWVRTNSAATQYVAIYNPGSTGTEWRPMVASNGKEITEIEFYSAETLDLGEESVLSYAGHRHLLRPLSEKAELESARARAAYTYDATIRVGDSIHTVAMPLYYLARATATPAGSRESIGETWTQTVTIDGGDP